MNGTQLSDYDETCAPSIFTRKIYRICEFCHEQCSEICERVRHLTQYLKEIFGINDQGYNSMKMNVEDRKVDRIFE